MTVIPQLVGAAGRLPHLHANAGTALYLLVGDVTRTPVRKIAVPWNYPKAPGDGSLARATRLKVFHLNDLHGHVVRFTPRGREPVLSRIAGWVGEQRRRAAHDPDLAVLFLAAGDDVSGSVLDVLQDRSIPAVSYHAGYRLLSAAGLDAGVVGNHDFDFGAKVLARAVASDARFPLLAANLIGSEELSDVLHPAAVFVVHGIRIGVIGLTTPARLRRRSGERFVVTDPLHAVHNLLPAFRPLCDVVIILSHLGYRRVGADPVDDYELACSLSPGEVHLIIGGHSHHVLNEDGLEPTNVVNGIPIAQAGSMGRFLGEVTLQLEGTSSASFRSRLSDMRLLPTSSLPVDEQVERDTVRPVISELRSHLRRVIGVVEADPALSTESVRDRIGLTETPLTNLVADALAARCRANNLPVDLALIDSSVVRAGLPVGSRLTVEDWFQVMPHADQVRLYHLTGRHLLALLKDNVRRIGYPDEPAMERGFSYFSRELRYCLERGSGRDEARLLRAFLGGNTLENRVDDSLLVAAFSHWREGARVWQALNWNMRWGQPVDPADWPATDTNFFIRREVITYIEQWGGVTWTTGARCDGRLKIVDGIIAYEDCDVLDQSLVCRSGDGRCAKAPAGYCNTFG